MKTKRVIIRTRRVTPEEAGKILGVPWKRVQQLKKLVRENAKVEAPASGIAGSSI